MQKLKSRFVLMQMDFTPNSDLTSNQLSGQELTWTFLDLEKSFSPSYCPILPTVAFPQDVAEIMGEMQVGKSGSLQEQSILLSQTL